MFFIQEQYIQNNVGCQRQTLPGVVSDANALMQTVEAELKRAEEIMAFIRGEPTTDPSTWQVIRGDEE